MKPRLATRTVSRSGGVQPPEDQAGASGDVAVLSGDANNGVPSTSDSASAMELARTLGLAYVNPVMARIEPQLRELVPEKLASKHTCCPLRKEEAIGTESSRRRPGLFVVLANPTDLVALQELEFASGCLIKPVVGAADEIRQAMEQLYSPDAWLEQFMEAMDDDGVVEIVDAHPTEEVSPSAPAVRLLEHIIERGIRAGASDIHVEPSATRLLIRFRVRGVLKEFTRAPKWLHASLISRVKILAQLDITERRVPQDGSIQVTSAERCVDVRVSTLPTQFGEKVVMRLLSTGDALPTPEKLGLEQADQQKVKWAVDQPQGMILVTGPTGSGKTTFLYSLLREKANPGVNITTVEDPIELRLEGVNQVQINPKAGLTFAATLRSLLRQDPDVLLVGEIRDSDTAEIAFRAASTGRLVLSTLHTRGTIATVQRLLDLGLEPSAIGNTTNLIVAQRLVRTICPDCIEPYEPEPMLLHNMRFSTQGRYFRGTGCDTCDGTGFSGRLGIFELLRITPEIRALIGRRATEAELRKAAIASGTRLLLENAREKVTQGITTVEEVQRVFEIDEIESVGCPGCGATLEASVASCPHCGYAINPVCTECRRPLQPDWQVCPFCMHARRPAPGGTGALKLRAEESDSDPKIDFPVPTILVVDDDPVSRRVAVHALARMPFQARLREASGGEEALSMIRRERPDLVVLDVTMPDMDGLEVCRRLRADLQTAFTPILMLTGNTDEASRSQAFLMGTDDYMTKPLSVPELHTRTRRLLNRNYDC